MSFEDLALKEDSRRAAGFSAFLPLSASIGDPPEPAIQTGIAPLDEMLGGGYAPGLHVVAGYQHNGKTMTVNTMLHNNRAKRIAFFTPDETVDMVASSLLKGVGLDPKMPKSKRIAAMREFYPHLGVADEVSLPDKIIHWLHEYSQFHGGEPDLVVFDYLSCLKGHLDAPSQMQWFKTATKTFRCPWLVLHQTNRGGATGQPLSADALKGGGEDAAFTIVAVYRRFFDKELGAAERAAEERHPTVNIQIIKNKQQQGQLSPPFGWTLSIDKQTGLIRPRRKSEKLNPSPLELLHRDEEEGVA